MTVNTHVETKANKVKSKKRIIIRSFTYLYQEMFRLLFKALFRPHLEYAPSVWCPYLKKHTEVIENMQRRSTKLIPTLKNLMKIGYRKFELPSLRFRRLNVCVCRTGGMIEVYKILYGVYDGRVTLGMLSVSGHSRLILKSGLRPLCSALLLAGNL